MQGIHQKDNQISSISIRTFPKSSLVIEGVRGTEAYRSNQRNSGIAAAIFSLGMISTANHIFCLSSFL
jgi:hypothetical protein